MQRDRMALGTIQIRAIGKLLELHPRKRYNGPPRQKLEILETE